jgi:hypothetical protein
VTHHYTAYGLCFASDVELPELIHCGPCARPQVHVRRGRVPHALASPVTQSRVHQSSHEGMLLRIDGVADYFVHDGEEIVVQPRSGADDHDIRVYMLGTCIGALLHQRGALVLHASAIRTEQGAVLFAGHSGAGKSTLLGEMLRRGYPMMVDDVCAVVDPDAPNLPPIVMPAYPRTRLWADAAAHLDVDTSWLRRTRAHMEKFERQVPGQFWGHPAPLRAIYHLLPTDDLTPGLTRVAPLEALPILLATTYRRVLVRGFGRQHRHFELASSIARLVPVVQVVRSPSSSIDGLTERVIHDIAARLIVD